MDTDQQVRLNFLEESSEYFDQIEQVLLGLETAESKSRELDIALRAAHSIKGSAGMMGFPTMGQVAHRLEDFFKILRARQVPVDTELETLLLKGVDCLKDIRERLVNEEVVDEAWVDTMAHPTFEQLRSRLGELSEEDEDRLLAGEEENDVALLIFNNGADEILTRFEQQSETLTGEPLRESLLSAASQLSNLGLMGELDSFVALCSSVQTHAQTVTQSQLPALTGEVLKVWQRAQSLIQLGRAERIPSELHFIEAEITGFEAPNDDASSIEAIEDGIDSQISAALTLETINASNPAISQTEPSPLTTSTPDGVETAVQGLDAAEIANLQAEMAAALEEVSVSEFSAAPPSEPISSDLEEIQTVTGFELPSPELSELQDAIAQIELPETSNQPALDSDYPTTIQPPLPTAAPPETETSPLEQSFTARPAATRLSPPRHTPTQRGVTLRVAAEDLQQINTLFGTLVLERNAIGLRQQQLTTFANLLKERMDALEAFNVRLRQWYDRASMEGLTAPSASPSVMDSPSLTAVSSAFAPPLNFSNSSSREFDTLEMDQYSELHLLAQEQMETVVQLQEVNADIQLGLQEMGQAIQQLNSSTRLLQGRITRTQMRPFSDIVTRFPRVIRDLSVQYNKKVNLNIEGETTLIERVALESLTDPLNHLLRNSFDHGIETAEERLAAGKPAQGTITLRASQQGNQVRIAISDDGRGINLDKIRDRVRKHDIPEEHIAQMTERELLSLIFDAGFSTAEKVTELSGRGVGMDVVRANIEKLSGDIQIETRLGEGTTFVISIPLNLSVLRVMLLEQRRMLFAVPVDAVAEMVLCKPEMIVRSPDQLPYLLWNNRQVPVEDITENLIFRSQSEPITLDGTPSIAQPLLLIIRDTDRYHAIPIERFWREQEVAVRPIISPMPMPAGFSGATVLGDGRVVPLVDLLQMLRSSNEYRGLATLEAELAEKAAQQQYAEAQRLAESGEAVLSESDFDIDVLTQDFSRQTILIIDDSVHVRRYLTATLERAGYAVEQAKDGQEGVDKLLGGLQVSAVLCDVEMPRLDGYGVLDEIKSRPEFSHLPITMLTSRNSEKHRKLAMNLGASAYFSKPYNEQELLRSLETFVK